ncbi:indolepyruvate decarboxylase [Motilibacter rhizosphaerae]|uniref:Alpha-keto-acid decarboxylase n=1 Tax=Motilibacter rhizosphaerae TaxID=598652 RepID=A0A4Q7NQE0_9ACTN|nr:thiamine pyrophosphate-binding protein [Motilibacter rhizosphaerae]RZS87433.1 indolepyruvate decarboxylase [Motilibacter rhizosphaerae]
MDLTVGGYLGARLRQCGVGHLFGLPGDYSMALLDELLATGLDWVGTTNELGAAYAADGYARRRGFGVVATTFGVGELSALNGVAGAYAESVPLLALTGGPATSAVVAGTPVHHSLLDGDLTRFSRAYAEVTAAAEVLALDTAAEQIDRLLQLALDELLPVHLTVPCDVAVAPVQGAERLARPLVARSSDPESLAEFEEALRHRLSSAQPVALSGRLAVRTGLRGEVRALADAGVPVATLLDAKGLLDEAHPSSLGCYVGALSPDPAVVAPVEDSDCLVVVGAVLSDLVTGMFSAHLKPAVTLGLHEAQVGEVAYPRVELRDAVAALVRVASGAAASSPQLIGGLDQLGVRTGPSARDEPASIEDPDQTGLTQEALWRELAAWLPPGALLVADAGSAYFGAAGVALPAGAELVGQPAWASIGWTIPALLGLAVGGDDRPLVLVVGDGAAQLTVQELSTVLARGFAGTVLLLDNGGYTVERAIRSPEAAYQDIARWDWRALVRALAPGVRVETALVETAGELRQALRSGSAGTPRFLQVVLPRDDTPPLLQGIARGLGAAH